MTDLVTDYSLVNFIPVTVKSKERMLAVSQQVDKANGYIVVVNLLEMYIDSLVLCYFAIFLALQILLKLCRVQSCGT